MADDVDYQALFGPDDAAAQVSAQALAKALRQRRAAGQLGLITGDPAMGAVGKEMTGDADKMEQALVGAAQHRAGLDVQRKHLDVQSQQLQAMMGYRGDQLGLKREQIDAQNELKRQALEQRGSERIATHDALGNPIFASKFGGGGAGRPPARPGLVPGASAGGPPVQPSGQAPIAPPAGPGAAPGGAPGGPPGAAPPSPAGPPPSKGIPDGRGGFILSPQALDQAAKMASLTGTMPPVVRGKGGQMIAAAIWNRAAELYPEANLAGNKASYQADTGSLKHQQQLLDLTQSWETTGKANLGVLKGISQKLVDAGSPLVNKPLRWLYQNAGGDPTVTSFRAAHAAVVNEYAKILSGNTGGGGVTEGARHEAEAMLPLDATPAQIAAAAAVLESDAGNRLSSLTAQLGSTKQRLSGGGGGEKKATHRFNPATGKIEAL